MFTISQATQWAAERSAELDASRQACEHEGVRKLNRLLPHKSKELWDSGCWLEEVLRTLGASSDDIERAQFCSGQRAFGGDAWSVVVAYANEFAGAGSIQDQPGEQLADRINDELLGAEGVQL